MATLSAIFQISCLLHLGQKGGRGAGVGVRCHKLGQYCAFSFFFFFFFANTHLEWCEQPE